MADNLFTPLDVFEVLKQLSHPTYIDIMAHEYCCICKVPMNGTYENWKKPDNKCKNLYENIPCSDDSRVILFEASDGADYITANYVYKCIISDEKMYNNGATDGKHLEQLLEHGEYECVEERRRLVRTPV